jgi:hypothetical protein
MNKLFSKKMLGASVLLLALAFASCSQQIEGSGVAVELNYDLDSFNSFDLRGAVDADIEQTGTDYSVTITIDDNLTDYVESRVDRGVLKIGLDRLYSYRNLHFTALIRIPSDVDPSSLTVAEAARVDMNISSTDSFILSAAEASIVNVAPGWVSSGNLDFSLQDASQVTIGDSAANNGGININLRDASSLELGSGTSNSGNLDIYLGEASRLYMGTYEVADVEISARKASTATVRSSGGSITGSLYEASSLTYRGTPSSVSVSTSGASRVFDGT